MCHGFLQPTAASGRRHVTEKTPCQALKGCHGRVRTLLLRMFFFFLSRASNRCFVYYVQQSTKSAFSRPKHASLVNENSASFATESGHSTAPMRPKISPSVSDSTTLCAKVAGSAHKQHAWRSRQQVDSRVDFAGGSRQLVAHECSIKSSPSKTTTCSR